MKKAAKALLKFDDFKSFSKSKTDVKTFICNVNYAQFVEEKQTIVFEINANRFLRNMVRAIVGTLIDVGRKKISLKEFEEIILKKNRSSAGFSAPAKGLFLSDIFYDWDKIK
jgi:tRNA pseudouridine38-40 synthase